MGWSRRCDHIVDCCCISEVGAAHRVRVGTGSGDHLIYPRITLSAGDQLAAHLARGAEDEEPHPFSRFGAALAAVPLGQLERGPIEATAAVSRRPASARRASA